MLEARVAARTADLTRSLEQRNLLLREVYHRVKNNLQVVDSLINAEARRIPDPTARGAFARMRHRVFTMGQAHQQMIASSDLRHFSIAPFRQDLVTGIGQAAAPGAALALDVVADPIPVGLDFATPLGLIVSELVSQAAQQGGITALLVAFRRDVAGRTALLTVTANGAELPATTGPGSWITAGLLHQFGGRMELAPIGGSIVTIGLPTGGSMTRISGSVLVVDDEFLIAELLTAMIEDLGLMVCGCAATAAEAKSLASEHRPELVLMEIRLRWADDGVDAALHIHRHVGSRVIFITGSRGRKRSPASRPTTPQLCCSSRSPSRNCARR